MSTLSVTNTFANDTTADADEVNANFTDIVDYVNSDVIVRDGSIAFTAVPTGPNTDPSSANHLARKSYVDDHVGRQIGYSQTLTHTLTANDSYQSISIVTITNPGKAIGIIAHGFVSQIAGASSSPLFYQACIGISLDGGSTYTYGDAASSFIESVQFDAYNVFHYRAGTPTGDIKITIDHYQQSGGITFGNTPRSSILYDLFKVVTV